MNTEIQGIPTRYERAGSGPPVLVLHGWGASVEAVGGIVNGLKGVADAIAVDLPGFGQTGMPPEPWGVSDYAGWVLAFLDSLGLDEPIDVVGHSHGGRVAIWIAAHRPERIGKLVLTDAAGIRHRPPKWYLKVGLAKTAKHAGRRLGPPGRALQRQIAGRSASTDYAAAGALRPTMAKVVNEDLTHLLPRIRASTLLIWGSDDDATPLADGHTMEKLIPDAGLVVFEGAGHFAYADQPQRFGTVVRHFLVGS